MKYLSLVALLFTTTCVWAESGVNELTESEKKSGWKLLFDGESFEGWRNYKKDDVSDGWKVVDGAMVRAAKGAGDIITDKKYDQFELSLEYKISKGGNSGIMFHVLETDGPPWHTGPEIQVQDNVDGHDPQKAGWLYQLYKPQAPRWAREDGVLDATRPVGQWNQIYLRIKDDDCEVCMNGLRYYRFKIGDESWNERVAESKFAKFEGFGAAGEGYIALQDHGNEVAYRNVKLREINDDGTVPQPIDGKMGLSSELAFPNLKWDQWDPVDDAGQLRPLRLIELTFAKDSNRLYAVSQQGRIWSFENRDDVTESKLFLDIRDQVKDWKGSGANEQGLLGLAMHPKFNDNGLFYVYYTRPDNASVVSQFKVNDADPAIADPDSEKVLMEIEQPFQNHNGGAIEFGPDGFLYIALGDGGYRNDPHANGQDLSTLLGSILRIDVDNPADGRAYGIPSDNPFIKVEGARHEIYAFGLRNPWRIAFDKESGRLWCGDVGQELWEEVDVIEKGGNYGWSDREGFHPFGNRSPNEPDYKHIAPVWEYDHQIGKSITGGRVYRGSRVPELAGKYIYADYVTGTIWALSYDPESNSTTRNEQVTPDNVAVLAFGEDQSGEVFYLTNSSRGECIYRFTK